MDKDFDYKRILGYTRRKHMSFSNFVENFIESPQDHLHTSSSLIFEAIKHFGYKVVIRSGEPVVSYNIFKDIFSDGVNAVYGQESCIKKMVDVIESISKESGPNRGIILLGPPASGKTNVVDLITMALEEYSKAKSVKLYSFYYHFADKDDPEKFVEIRSSFIHNPILLFTTILHQEDGIIRPRQKLFEYINQSKPSGDKVSIPSYYQNASLDKRNLDIIESLLQNSINRGKTLFDILEEYVRVEEIEFTNAQGKGISNIDNMNKLEIRAQPIATRDEALKILNSHLPTKLLYRYDGALVSSNRGLLHIHDAFADSETYAYKPLLMLLGSGKVSLEATQASVDTVVVITTNLEDMEKIDRQLTSTKLLDRIEKIPVNYLLDAYSEIDILKRDMSMIKKKYDVDPNLFKIASFFSVMTRLLPPIKTNLPSDWSDEKKKLYRTITPEQKLFIYTAKPSNPMGTIRSLPYWHPFRNQAAKLGIDLYDEDKFMEYFDELTEVPTLESCGIFTNEQLSLIDDHFMRELRSEYHLEEGRYGMSIRQLQNIMRNTISSSDGRAILVNNFIDQLISTIQEGQDLHHWLKTPMNFKKGIAKVVSRKIGPTFIKEAEGGYGDYRGLIKVVQAIYDMSIQKEIITATVDRDPIQIESDLRKYMQFALLYQALENKAFSHIMVPKFSFIDHATGEKVNRPDENFMRTIEEIAAPDKAYIAFRRNMTQKFFDLNDSGKLKLESGKTVIHSRNDKFLICFEKVYSKLLSHRKTEEGIDGDMLTESFFKKQYDAEGYLKYSPEVRKFTETVLHNMAVRFGYSRKIALSTVVYALRQKIIDFKQILN